jgi:LysM repeat protein
VDQYLEYANEEARYGIPKEIVGMIGGRVWANKAVDLVFDKSADVVFGEVDEESYKLGYQFKKAGNHIFNTLGQIALGVENSFKLQSPRSTSKAPQAANYAQQTNKSTTTTSAPSTRANVTTSTSGSAGKTYTVSAGQTFNGIAQSLGVSPATLRALNPQITNYDKIGVNQKINAPSSTGGGGSSGTSTKPGTVTPAKSNTASSTKGKGK